VPVARVAIQPPTLFPEELAENHIKCWSNTGDIVLDPMCGSCTKGEMALMNDRDFIGIDISPEYIEIARQRFADVGLPVELRQSA